MILFVFTHFTKSIYKSERISKQLLALDITFYADCIAYRHLCCSVVGPSISKLTNDTILKYGYESLNSLLIQQGHYPLI
jgi:hypothetical protein